MFIKIRYFIKTTGPEETKLSLRREIVRECIRYSIGPEKCESKDAQRNILLTIEGVGNGETIEFPERQPSENVEIFVMNNSGATIERYRY